MMYQVLIENINAQYYSHLLAIEFATGSCRYLKQLLLMLAVIELINYLVLVLRILSLKNYALIFHPCWEWGGT